MMKKSAAKQLVHLYVERASNELGAMVIYGSVSECKLILSNVNLFVGTSSVGVIVRCDV